MNRLKTAAVLFFVTSMTLVASTALAATVYSALDFSSNSPSTGQIINNVNITDTGTQYRINMLLNGTPIVGTSYSVLMATTPALVFSSPDFSADANATLNRRQQLSVSFSADDLVTGDPLGVTHIWSGNSLTWLLAKSDLFNGANFWFAGQSYKTGDLDTIYSQTKVAATPIPSAAWLLGSGILGLVGLSRRKRSVA